METAGKKFLGEHDFRNFCKMDANNVHNYRRRVVLFEIIPCSERLIQYFDSLSYFFQLFKYLCFDMWLRSLYFSI